MEETDKPVHTDIKLHDTISEGDFVRAVILKLAGNVNTPTDVLSCEFSDVWKNCKEFLTVTADTEAFITCQVGTDREEKYLGTEKYFDKQLNKQSERVVEKTRTVTDWSPFSNHVKKQTTCAVLNADEEKDATVSSRASAAMKTSDKEDMEIIKDSDIAYNAKAVARAKKKCVDICGESAKPSGKTKDFKCQGTAEVEQIHCVRINEYSLDCVYNGKKYGAKSFASGEMRLDMPFYPSDAENANKAYHKKLLPLYISAAALIVLGIVLCIFSGIAGGLCIAAGIIFGLLILFVIMPRYAKKMKSARQTVKKDACVALLAKRGLKPLTASEETTILSAK